MGWNYFLIWMGPALEGRCCTLAEKESVALHLHIAARYTFGRFCVKFMNRINLIAPITGLQSLLSRVLWAFFLPAFTSRRLFVLVIAQNLEVNHPSISPYSVNPPTQRSKTSSDCAISTSLLMSETSRLLTCSLSISKLPWRHDQRTATQDGASTSYQPKLIV